jgi:hypothetical protein
MVVYHGCASWNVEKLISGKSARLSLFVTDTVEHAARYANAQATEEVSAKFQDLKSWACIVELETEDPIEWSRRSNNHNTLDTCETTIRHWQVKSVTVKRGTYAYDNQHAVIDRIAAQVKVIEL